MSVLIHPILPLLLLCGLRDHSLSSPINAAETFGCMENLRGVLLIIMINQKSLELSAQLVWKLQMLRPELSASGLCLEEELRDVITCFPKGNSVSYFFFYLHPDLSPFALLSLSKGFGGWSLLASFLV